MCSTCCCPNYCSCNTTCCFGFIVPLRIGTVFAALWVLFSGLTFPVMAVIFWPHSHILIPSCLISVAVSTFVAMFLANMFLKQQLIFRVVLYGVFAAYAVGCVFVIVGLNVDRERTETAFIENFKSYFNVNVPRRRVFQMLQSIQIVYYTYLFFSYVYCGVVFQLFERKYGNNAKKQHNKESKGLSSLRDVEKGDAKASISYKSGSKEPKERKTVKIMLPNVENI